MRRRQRVFDDMLDAAREQADAAEANGASPPTASNGEPTTDGRTSEQRTQTPSESEGAAQPEHVATAEVGESQAAEPLRRLRELQQQNRTPQVELFGVKVPASRSQDTVFTFSFRLPEELRYVIQARCGELRISHQEFGRLAVEMLLSEIEADGDRASG